MKRCTVPTVRLTSCILRLFQADSTYDGHIEVNILLYLRPTVFALFSFSEFSLWNPSVFIRWSVSDGLYLYLSYYGSHVHLTLLYYITASTNYVFAVIILPIVLRPQIALKPGSSPVIELLEDKHLENISIPVDVTSPMSLTPG